MYIYLSLVQLLCYCIGYTSNNHWSTSIIPLDQYQEKLQERRRKWEASQSVEPEDRREIDRLTRVLQERERELQEERREKEQVRTRLQQQLEGRERQLQQAQQQGQEREREIQQGREREQDLQRQLQERDQQLQQSQQQLQEREKKIQQGSEREQNLQQQLQLINSVYNTGISRELGNIVELVIKFVILFHFASVILSIVIIETSNIIPAYNILAIVIVEIVCT